MEAIDLNDDGQNDVMDEDIEDHEVIEISEANKGTQPRSRRRVSRRHLLIRRFSISLQFQVMSLLVLYLVLFSFDLSLSLHALYKMEAIDLNDDSQNDVMDEDIEDHEVIEISEANKGTKPRSRRRVSRITSSDSFTHFVRLSISSWTPNTQG
ncbi:hypothetical protein DY000_02034383 [Brassica cretica]|uniref:Transmembrane protein n=1 Tax=Brassica cretica TaxID=69181 RepID=A0ABQ7DHB2_BRACR|nr:hypothetical protein DY000_02034383 [Brassica cretica]